MTTSQESAKAETSWQDAFASRSGAKFAAAFAPEVTLHGSALVTPVHGREAVSQVMAAASAIYDQLEFTHRARTRERTYLEWRAVAFGDVELAGITVLVEDANDQIVELAIHHRPLDAALRFSAELRDRVGSSIDPAHFYQGEHHRETRD